MQVEGEYNWRWMRQCTLLVFAAFLGQGIHSMPCYHALLPCPRGLGYRVKRFLSVARALLPANCRCTTTSMSELGSVVAHAILDLLKPAGEVIKGEIIKSIHWGATNALYGELLTGQQSELSSGAPFATHLA